MRNMKYISKLYIATLAIVAGSLVLACSNEEQIAPVEVSFTSPGEFDMASLDSCESIVNSFELTSSGTWNLYSDKMWVKLSLQPDGEFFNDIQGGEGKHTIYIKVTDDAHCLDDSEASVTLIAGGVSRNIVTIERKGKNYEFALLSNDGEALDKIKIGSSATVWVAPEANFDCSIITWPDWLIEPEFQDGGYTLEVVPSLKPYPYTKEGTVTFGNVDGTLAYELPVVYAMEPDYMIIESEYTPWDWRVSLDGKTFVQKTESASGENEEIVVENGFVNSVMCLNYDYKLFTVQEENGQLTMADAARAWIRASKTDFSHVAVSVAPLSSGSRSGCLFAVPAGYCNNFTDSLRASRDINEFIDGNLSYVVLMVKQEELDGSNGFGIVDDCGELVECVTEEKYYEFLCHEYSIDDDITTCNLVPGKSYTIETRLKKGEWSGNFALIDYETKENVRPGNWGNPKAKLGDDGYYRINIKVPNSPNKEFILRLYTPQNVNIKALVIRTVTQ